VSPKEQGDFNDVLKKFGLVAVKAEFEGTINELKLIDKEITAIIISIKNSFPQPIHLLHINML
jgi:hypothetical protein